MFEKKLLDEIDRIIESDPRDTWWQGNKEKIIWLLIGTIPGIITAVLIALVNIL